MPISKLRVQKKTNTEPFLRAFEFFANQPENLGLIKAALNKILDEKQINEYYSEEGEESYYRDLKLKISASKDINELGKHFLAILFRPFGLMKIGQRQKAYLETRKISRWDRNNKKEDACYIGTASREYKDGFSNHSYNFAFYLGKRSKEIFITDKEFELTISLFYFLYITRGYHSFCEIDAGFLRAAEDFECARLASPSKENGDLLALYKLEVEKQGIKVEETREKTVEEIIEETIQEKMQEERQKKMQEMKEIQKPLFSRSCVYYTQTEQAQFEKVKRDASSEIAQYSESWRVSVFGSSRETECQAVINEIQKARSRAEIVEKIQQKMDAIPEAKKAGSEFFKHLSVARRAIMSGIIVNPKEHMSNLQLIGEECQRQFLSGFRSIGHLNGVSFERQEMLRQALETLKYVGCNNDNINEVCGAVERFKFMNPVVTTGEPMPIVTQGVFAATTAVGTSKEMINFRILCSKQELFVAAVDLSSNQLPKIEKAFRECLSTAYASAGESGASLQEKVEQHVREVRSSIGCCLVEQPSDPAFFILD